MDVINKAINHVPYKVTIIILGMLQSIVVWGHAGHIPAIGKPAHKGAVGPVSVEACGHSEHLGPHNNTLPQRRDHTTGMGDDVRAVVVNGQKGLRCRTLSEINTPFGGRIRALAKRSFKQNNLQYFEQFAYLEKGWAHQSVFPAAVDLVATCWIALAKKINEATEAHDTEVTAITAMKDPKGWQKLEPLTETVSQATSIPIIKPDGVAWKGTEPEVSYLLTSKLKSKNGALNIEYRMINKTPSAINFIFPQIKTPKHPSGWTGVVKGNGFAMVSVALEKPEALYIQKTQLYFWSDGDQDGYQAVALHMYANESALEFKGQVKYLKAKYNAAINAARLEFQLENDSAEGAVVYRDSAKGLELIQRIEKTIDEGKSVTVFDPFPPAGKVSYRVKAGRGVNGRYSKKMTISIPADKPRESKQKAIDRVK